VSDKRSKYLEAGSPTCCFLPSCRQPFLDRCIRGNDGHYYCSQRCAGEGKKLDLRQVAPLQQNESPRRSPAIAKQSAQISTVCGCIDHCFAFAMWCNGFARHVDPEDMMWGLDKAFDVVSDATRLQSFLALRKVDEFLRSAKSKPDDLIAGDLGIDVAAVLRDVGNSFLTSTERVNINKGAAHLTEKLTLDPDSEVDLQEIINRSLPVFVRLVAALRKIDAAKWAAQSLDKTDTLLKFAQEQTQKPK
jgi:hypothetical protein